MSSEPAAGTSRGHAFLAWVERMGNRLPGPVLLFLWLIAAVVALSLVGVAAGWNAVNPVTGQTLEATSLLSSASLERLFVEMPRTFASFPPLGYALLVMFGAGIAERTGLFGDAMRGIVRLAPARLLTPIVLFAGMMGNQAADAAFVIMRVGGERLSGCLFQRLPGHRGGCLPPRGPAG